MRPVKSKSKNRLSGFLFVAPSLIFLLIFVGIPLVYNIIISLKNLDIITFNGNTSEFIGFENYKKLFNSPVFIQALRQTFIFTVLCLLFQFTFGFLLALLFNKNFKLSGTLKSLNLVPYMMPIAVSALTFKNMFQTSFDSGVINYLLAKIGILSFAGEPIGWLIDGHYAMWAIIIVNCWIGIPFNMLLLGTGLTNIPEELYEAGSIDGANKLQKFIYITIPQLKTSMLAVLMLGFIYTFKVFDLVYMLTSGGPNNSTELLSTYAYRLSFKEFNFSEGAAAACILFICLAIVGLFYLLLVRSEEGDA